MGYSEKETLISSLESANKQIEDVTSEKLDLQQNFDDLLDEKLAHKLKPYQNAKDEIDSYQEVLEMKNTKIKELTHKLAVAEEASRDNLEVKMLVKDMKVNEKKLNE